MPSPTAAQVAAAEEIVARIVSADAIAGRRSGEARQAHWRAIMATVLAEREAAVRAEVLDDIETKLHALLRGLAADTDISVEDVIEDVEDFMPALREAARG